MPRAVLEAVPRASARALSRALLRGHPPRPKGRQHSRGGGIQRARYIQVISVPSLLCF